MTFFSSRSSAAAACVSRPLSAVHVQELLLCLPIQVGPSKARPTGVRTAAMGDVCQHTAVNTVRRKSTYKELIRSAHLSDSAFGRCTAWASAMYEAWVGDSSSVSCRTVRL